MQKVLFGECEIVQSQEEGVSHGPKALLHVFRITWICRTLFVVMELEGCKVGLGKASPFRPEAYGHGWAEDCQTLVQPDDLLLVQPQQGTVHQPGHGVILDSAPQGHLGPHCGQQLAEGVSASKSVPRLPGGRLASRWSSSSPAAARRSSASLSNAFHSRCKVTCSVSPSRPAHPEASPAAALAPTVGGDAADDPPQKLRQGIRVTFVFEPLVAIRRCSVDVSPLPMSGSVSRRRSIRARSSAEASSKRFREERSTAYGRRRSTRCRC